MNNPSYQPFQSDYELEQEDLAYNLYLYLFDTDYLPTNFIKHWAIGSLVMLIPTLQLASRKLDPAYNDQYDLWLEGIRIKVQTSRVVDAESNAPLYLKALTSDSTRPFDMNFQQIKPGLCDVFVWLGVWRDQLRFWVLTAAEVAKNRYYSTGQHRGNVGEGQLHLKHDNLQEFKTYEVHPSSLYQAILAAGQRQLKTRG